MQDCKQQKKGELLAKYVYRTYFHKEKKAALSACSKHSVEASRGGP